MSHARSRFFAGGIALSLLFAGGCAPAGWTLPAKAEEADEKLVVSGDIFDRPGNDNPCRGREITITVGRDGDQARETEIARGLIEQCRPTLTYEELLYRYTRGMAERDDARAALQAMATVPPPVTEAPPEPPPPPPPQVITQPAADPYPAYSSGSAHPAAPVIFEQDMFQPPVMQAAPVAPIIIQPTPVYVSPPPAIFIAPPRPRPPHYRPPQYQPPQHNVVPAPPVVHRPPPQARPPAYTPPVVHNPASPPPTVYRPPSPPPVVHRPPPVVHQPPPTVYRPPPAPSPPPTVHRPAPAPVVHSSPPSPPPASAARPPAGSVGQPGQDRSTYGK